MSINADQAAQEGVRANIAGIAEAVNTMDLDKYGSLITTDFVNMNKDLRGAVSCTVGRQARLDVLREFFSNSPFSTHATMMPAEIYTHGDCAFARIDGTLKLTPKEGAGLDGFSLKVDLCLFFCRDDTRGWLSERSMGIETGHASD